MAVLLSAAVLGLLAGCASVPASPAAPSGRESRPATNLNSNGPETSLQKGMTADAVRRIMGQPLAVNPMKAPTGKAEVWVYRRTSQGAVRQVQVAVKTIPIQSVLGSDGQMHVIQSIDEPVYEQQFEIIDETISLLMFNDRFLERHRSVQSRFAFR